MADSQTVSRIEHLTTETGWLLITAGVVGVIVPGVVGIPFLLAGAVAVTPGGPRLLARWIGAVEFGIYVYAWTWLQMVGDIIHLGLPLTAQRIVPEYTQRNDLDGLRGFLLGSRWVVFAAATVVAIDLSKATRQADPTEPT